MAGNIRTQKQDKRLAFFNRIIYASMPGAYNAMDMFTFGAWWRLVRRALEFVPPGKRVLEVGFGPGRLHVELSRRSRQCLGIDLASGMCRFTRRRLLRAGLPAMISRGSVFSLPYAEAAFDVVVSTFAFSGFPDDRSAIEEMARVVNPGGRIVLVDICLPPDRNRLGTSLAQTWLRFGDFLYDYQALMETAGLNIRALRYFGPGNHITAVVGEKPPVH